MVRIYEGIQMFIPTYHPPARKRAQLTATDVSVMRGTTQVLSHLNIVVTPTARLAIVGENGRGKSTLLNVLAGLISPDTGTVQRLGTLGMAEQEMDAVDGRTVGQAVADSIKEPLAVLVALDSAAHALAEETEGAAEQYAIALEHAQMLDAWDAERRVQIALEALNAETDLTKILSDLSVGQRYRVRLACLLGAHDDFLLLDEPTNHLDYSGLEFLTTQLRNRQGGVVVVSHDRALLSEVAESVLDLDPTMDQRPRIFGGGYAGYKEGRRAERERWEREYYRQQEEHLRLQESLSAAQNRLISGWRPEKGTNKHGRATRAGNFVQNVHRRQEALEAHAITIPNPPQIFRFPELPARKGMTFLTVDNVTVTQRLNHPTSFTLAHSSRLVVRGPNGAGKSTLLRVAAGNLSPDTGTVKVADKIRRGYLPQETSLPLNRRADELYMEHIDRLLSLGVVRASQVTSLSQLGLLHAADTGKRVGELSMGQQRRLNLALVLAARPQVLLLDEPTNHLSITLVDELTEALGATEAAVVLATHDRQLIRDVEDWPHLELTGMSRIEPTN